MENTAEVTVRPFKHFRVAVLVLSVIIAFVLLGVFAHALTSNPSLPHLLAGVSAESFTESYMNASNAEKVIGFGGLFWAFMLLICKVAIALCVVALVGSPLVFCLPSSRFNRSDLFNGLVREITQVMFLAFIASMFFAVMFFAVAFIVNPVLT